MAMRQRKPAEKKFPAFNIAKEVGETEETDLKKVKAQILKELEENEGKDKEWFDKELEKNLKNIK
ncbi:MAG: hypothetical protein K9G49_04820 [Taibaiella sp.]|nr:hypothetical protein [Taibaiella sp.]